MNSHKTAMALGTLAAVMHLVWAVLVAIGAGQGLINFAYHVHMLRPAPTVAAFDLGTAVELIVVTFIIGYVVGFVFTKIWHKVR